MLKNMEIHSENSNWKEKFTHTFSKSNSIRIGQKTELAKGGQIRETYDALHKIRGKQKRP